MTQDGLTIASAVREMSCLAGAKIEKITQPEADSVLLTLHSAGGKRRLLISANPGECRIHMTGGGAQSPGQAPRFCMLLRKYIANGRITAIEQAGLERVVIISIDAKDELGGPRPCSLACEIMGKYSNIILLSGEGKILDSIKRVPPDMSSVRSVLPGVRYELPPMSKADPLTASEVTLAELYRAPGDMAEQIMQTTQGVSRQTAAEIIFRRFGGEREFSENMRQRLAAGVKEFCREAIFSPRPRVQLDMSKKPVFYSALPYESFAGGSYIDCDSVNEALDTYYSLRVRMEKLEAMRRETAKQLKKHITRIQKKLKIQRETLMEADGAENWRIKGELLTANLYRCPRGAGEIEVENYYDECRPLKIALDSALSPSANAQKFYKKFDKLSNARSIAGRQAEAYDAELKYLGELEYALFSAKELEDVAEVRLDMQRYGYLPAPRGKQPPRRDPLEDPAEYRSTGGLLILAGRNSRQNDALTMKAAGGEDIWFHARNTPGSHVILFTAGREPSERDIYEAAVIAAVRSKGAASGRANIDYCPRKNVWKANGARPGMVLYDGHRSMLAPADAKLAAALEVSPELSR